MAWRAVMCCGVVWRAVTWCGMLCRGALWWDVISRWFHVVTLCHFGMRAVSFAYADIFVGVERRVMVPAITSLGLCKPVPSMASSVLTLVTLDVSFGSQS